jgi:phosphosulfolactate synthase
MPKHPFEFVELPAERSTTKPRTTGLTMMLDFGVPVGRLEDLLTLVAPHVDLIKIAVGTSRIYRETYLDQKILLCEGHHVKPFIGGQFLEYLVATQGFDAAEAYFAEAKRVGFRAIEVSDNCVPLTSDQRKGLIAGAVEAGLEVHGEVGSKDTKQTAEELIGQAKDCLEAGAGVVLVEAAEIVVDGEVKRDLIGALKAELPADKVIYELPGPWIAGTSLSDVYGLKKFLIEEFGPDANIANVMPDDVFETEALRCGLSVVGPKEMPKAAE